MTDLRQAAQQALERLEACVCPPSVHHDIINPLRAALKQQQAEPVAWVGLLREARDNCKASIVEEGISASRKEYRIDLEARLTAALNTPQQQAEPDRWVIEKVGDKLMLNGNEVDPGTIELRLDGLTYRSSEKMEVRQQAEPVSELQRRYLESEKAFQQQAEPVERWLWVFEDRHGDRYTHKNLFYTADEAAESARICGVKAIKKIDSSKVMQQAEPVGEVINERGEVDYISYVPPVGTVLYTAQPQRKPLTDELEAAFKDGWQSAKAAHGIK